MAMGESKQQAALVCGSKMVRVCMVLLALGLSVYTIAPAVYWHVVAEDGDVLSKWVLQCPPCPPDLDPSPSPALLADSASKLLALAQKLNTTPIDCHGSNRCMKESIAQTFEQLLKEGVKLQKEAKIAQQRANSSGLLDASRKIVSRNPKATSGHAETELAKETARANLWEKRARDLGWKPSKPAGYQKYKKYIQMLDGGAR